MGSGGHRGSTYPTEMFKVFSHWPAAAVMSQQRFGAINETVPK